MRRPYLIIIILGLCVYFNALRGTFIWDDEFVVRQNHLIRSWSNIPAVFTRNVASGGGGGEILTFYRPLQIFTYMADYSLWRLIPAGYHLTNIALHIAASLALCWFVTLLFQDTLLSAIAGALFIIHPIHTEAVAYITGRADPLVAVFVFLSLIFYIRQARSRTTMPYAFAVAMFILAYVSRENSLILVLLYLLYHYTFKEKLDRKRFLPFCAITLLYIFLWMRLLRSYNTPDVWSSTLLQRLPGFFVALATYIRLLFLPLGLHMEYTTKLFSITHPAAVLGMALFAALLACALWSRTRNQLVFFSIAWFFITLFPSSNLIPLNAYMAEHWLYLPSVGFFLIGAQGLSRLYRSKNARGLAVACIIGILLFYSSATIKQNTYWKDPITLYEHTLRFAPESGALLNNLGITYAYAGENEKAIACLTKAIRVEPNLPQAYNNLGFTYLRTGRTDEAISLCRKAIQINPYYANAYSNLATAYFRKGEYAPAIEYCDKARELGFPNNALEEALKPYRR